MCFLINKKNILLILFFLLFSISLVIPISINNNNNCKNILLTNNKSSNNILRELSSISCTSTTYSKSDLQEECDNGPSSYDRVLKYSSYSSYISSHSYHTNGLNYVTSLFVDSNSHHYGNFMNDGVGMIILYIIIVLLIIGWIPLLLCFRKRCCLFDDCFYGNDCCKIFWHILTYFLAAAILSFLLVVLGFGR